MKLKRLKANIIIVHGLAEHLDRYDEITSYLNENEFNVIRYDQRDTAVRKENRHFIVIRMKS